MTVAADTTTHRRRVDDRDGRRELRCGRPRDLQRARLRGGRGEPTARVIARGVIDRAGDLGALDGHGGASAGRCGGALRRSAGDLGRLVADGATIRRECRAEGGLGLDPGARRRVVRCVYGRRARSRCRPGSSATLRPALRRLPRTISNLRIM